MKLSSGFNRVAVVNVGDNIDGRYHVLAMIADGGMGTVFLAEHMLIKRRVAVKVLHRDLAGDRDMIQRFMNEASAASKLGHPNIVESTDMGFTRDHIPFIVFEYLEGALLTEEIYRVGGLSVRRALRIAKQIASALEAAHAASIVHLDLKSDNIFLVDKDGTSDHAKVLDFGISRFTETDRAITQRDVVMGTPEFMSPEQVTSPDQVDARSDIYALGVVLYEMLAARRPFAGEDPRLLLHRIVHEPPPPLRDGSVPPELERIIFEKLLAKDPADRFSSMHDVGAALDAVLRGLGTAESIPPPLQAKPEPAAQIVEPVAVPRARWNMPLLALAFVAGAAGAVLGYVDRRLTDEARESSTHILENDAAELGNLVESSERSALLRAQTLGSSPMLRAAMETDAETIRDLVVNEHLFTSAPDEIVQISQLVGGNPIRVVSAPATADTLSTGRRLESNHGQLRVLASAPVLRQSGGIGGDVTISRSVDLAPLRTRLQAITVGARLEGLEHPLELVAPSSGVHDETDVRLTLPATTLALHARLPSSTRANPLRAACYATWAATALLLLAFFVLGMRGRHRDPHVA
jgi:tRNA A-37 threonylcarbamoyl transferase component Bud32